MLSILWGTIGVICCCTIIAIPVGIQCFKFVSFVFWPFGRDVIFSNGVGSFLLNVIWILIFGWGLAVTSCLLGLLWCITIVGIPVGLQCFKFASLSLCPFGKDILYQGGAPSLLLNILWLLISGLPLAIAHAAWGCALCVTIIGIPFGLQFFKLARLALLPFGSRVITVC